MGDTTADTTARRIFFDITDLMLFLMANTRPTGIQRVEYAVLRETLGRADRKHVRFGFLAMGSALRIVPAARLDALVAALAQPDIEPWRIRTLALRAMGAARKQTLRPSDVYMVLGTFWIGRYYTAALRRLSALGVFVAAYIHDLIPLTHPQFIRAEKRAAMQTAYRDMLASIDFACTNSRYVAGEVHAALAQAGRSGVPVEPALLAHDLPLSAHDADTPASLPDDYVLCVGSIDGRKNHLLLVDIWSILAVKYSSRLPRLVFVGKWWRNSVEVKARLRETGNAGGSILHIENADDAELAAIYRHCLFTIFPSFHEGWGLPVGESLGFGKPCLASNASAIPEVGGDLVAYFDPHDRAGAQALIERWLFDRDGLAQWSARIASDFRPRTWANMADDLYAAIDTCTTKMPPVAQAEPA